ncbi:MAG: histidine phosphatase family protein [Reyranellaceae bacterium]
MKTLCLLRHAKSAWPSGIGDFDRPLNGRGREAASIVGRYMAGAALAPDLVLCSAATRTRETLELAALFWKNRPTIVIEPELYLAGERIMLAQARRIEPRHGIALIIGHNPGTQALALQLAVGAPSHELDRLATKYPTGGLAVFDFEVEDWARIGPDTARLRSFVTPRSIAARG